VVFYSSSGASKIKAVYLLLLAVITVRGLIATEVHRRNDEKDTQGYRLALACALMLFAIVISLPVALSRHHSASIWFRDVIPYGLIAVSPLLALDAARNLSPVFLRWTLLVSGLVATASYAVYNIAVRQLASLPVTHLLYPSLLLPFALFSYACAQLLLGNVRVKWPWGVVAIFVLASVVGTGSRLGLLVLAAPVAMLFGRGGVRRLLRTLVLLIVAAAVIAFGLAVIAPAVGFSTSAVNERVRLTESAISHPTHDGSINARFSEGAAAWRVFLHEPVLGDGPGHLYTQYFPGSGQNSERFTLDTSVTVLTKFGVIGAACIAAGLVLLLLTSSAGGASDVLAALLGFIVVTILSLPISNPFEDKGFAFALVLLAGLGLQGRRATAIDPVEDEAAAKPRLGQADALPLAAGTRAPTGS
jgi:hypothetical protein